MRHRFTRRWRAPLATAVTAALFSSLLQTVARADDQPQDTAEPQRSSVVKNADRDAVLGKDWHKSQDRAWTTSGDTEGFHVLVADQNKAYAWRTAATLREPGFDADMWIGNACVTGSGKRAVVAYAPRIFTNKPELMARGAFTAVVDLASGAVTKLNRQASLAYFSPGCGTGETAVLTQDGGEDKNATRLIEVDAATGKLSAPVELKGQITSAVPVGEGFVAADSNRLVKIDKSGGRRTVAHTDRIPFQLKADAEGGVTYLDRPTGTSGPSPAAYTAPAPRSAAAAGDRGQGKGEARRVTAGDIDRADARRVKPAVLARGPLHDMDLSSSATGKVFITGDTQEADQLPGSVERRTDVPKDARATTRGEALVTRTEWSHDKPFRAAEKQAPAPRSADVDLKVLNTGKKAEFRVEPGDQAVGNPAQGAEPSPALTSPARPATARTAAFHARTASSIDDTAEPDRYCSVPRNDPRKQALQPKPRQIEWAVDQAITNNLNKHISRPANWKNLGMGAYKPQSLFPLLQLEGGGRIPAQVMLGVTAQESNMWQASRVVVPGVTGNPLIGNYYGIKYAANGQQNDPWGIHWDKADCGYGITQVTDGMRIQGKEKPEEQLKTKLQQEAAALDYTANIAAGVNILADKWNQTHKDGLTVNNGDPKYMENWFFALWAYNSGYYPKSEAGKNGGKWGVGFTNNPANPLWKANRRPFLESATGGDNYKDAAHPQDWPYQEKVLGWAARPLEALESPGKMVHGFRQAWWMNFRDRTTVKPPEGLFCTADNDCDPSKIGPDDKNEPGLGACNRKDLKCWWNKPVTWKKCDKGQCGNELLRFNDTYKEEADGTAYPPDCSTSGLPGNALIVDDVPDGTPVMRPGCAQPKKNSGAFKLDFATDSAKIDFQQLGAGYGGHFWFAHTRKDDVKGRRMKVTGTWNFDQKVSGPAKVMVHIPDHGAQTRAAAYEIDTAKGKRTKVVDQLNQGGKGKNRWVTLGAFLFDGNPKVRLTSITPGGTGDADIAFDAVAVAPMKGKWVHHTFDAVSTIDPHQNLDTNTPSPFNTPIRDRQTLYDWARNKTVGGAPWNDKSKPRVKGLTEFPACAAGTAKKDCLGAKTLAAMRAWSKKVADAGTSLTGTTSQAQWMGFTNPLPGDKKPADAFASDLDYKNKTHIEAGYVVGDDGTIVEDSEDFDVNWRVGNTRIAPFVADFVKATVADYRSSGITMPDLSYDALDANTVTGKKTRVHNPLETGWTPARAYLPHHSTPTIDRSGQCLKVKTIGGGVDGYRPLGGAPSTDKNMKAWVGQLQKAADGGKLPQEVADTAGDFYNMFFRELDIPGASGSLLYAAPPIWQNISVAFCSDGSVKSTQAVPNGDNKPGYGLVYQGYMPDLYLYHNDRMIDQTGKPATGPVQRGNFADFSNIPGVTSDKGNAYGKCDIAVRGNGGNPWNMTVPPLTTTNETPKRVIFCDDKTPHMTTAPDGD